MVRRAGSAKGRTGVGFLAAEQDLAGDAHLGLARPEVGDSEASLGIELGVLGTQGEPTQRDRADAAPLSIAGLEDPADEVLRGPVTIPGDGAPVLVLDAVASLFQGG